MRCSFCNKTEDQVKRLIVGHGVAICNECIDLCNNILAEDDIVSVEHEEPGSDENIMDTLPRPAEIKAYMDQYIIGQEKTKVALSVAVYNHYKRIFYPHMENDV